MDFTEAEAREFIVNQVQEVEAARLELNRHLYDMYNGDISTYLTKKLKSDLKETWETAESRAMPINFLRRIIDKMTKIYQTGVQRNSEPENEADQDKVDWYVRKLHLNSELNHNNELYNLFGYSLQSIANSGFAPISKAIPNHKFVPVSLNQADPTQMDLLILIMTPEQGKARLYGNEGDEAIYWVWTDEQFVIIDGNRNIRDDLMREVGIPVDSEGNVDLSNPFGTIPYVYLTRTKTETMPPPPKDTYQVAIMVPLLLSDLNYISKYQVFSIMYGVNVSGEDLPQAPNAFWFLQSDGEEGKPEVGTIKPSADIDKIIALISTQIQFWLESWGIKAGGIGNATSDSFASGISKLIDEMDITDAREKQATAYSQLFEPYFWDKLLKKIDPVWVRDPRATGVSNTHIYSSSAEVITTFEAQIPKINLTELTNNLVNMLNNRLITRSDAIAKLNPQMTAKEVEQYLLDIEAEAPKPITNEVIDEQETGNTGEG